MMSSPPPRSTGETTAGIQVVIPAKAGIQCNMKREYYVYILASRRNGTLYVGVTNDLARRVFQHQLGFHDGFTKKYKVHWLVYYETFDDIREAIQREKRLKKWNRSWKIALIEKENPTWEDICAGNPGFPLSRE